MNEQITKCTKVAALQHALEVICDEEALDRPFD